MSRTPVRRLVGVCAIAAITPLTAAAVVAAGTGGLSPARALAAGRPASARPLVIRISVPHLGRVLATPGRLPVYTYGPERKDHKIHCRDSCATAWPPVLVPAGTRVPPRIAGVTGTFGTIARSVHVRQLTRNRLPLYTFAFDAPGHATGNGVSGFAIARG